MNESEEWGWEGEEGREKRGETCREVECSEAQKIIDVGLFTKLGQWRLGA